MTATGPAQRWYSWGSPISEQQGEYFTYAKYLALCKEEEVDPVRIERFVLMLHQRGICVAPEDEHADNLFFCYDFKTKVKD